MPRFEIKIFDRQGTYLETLDRKSFKSHKDVNDYLRRIGIIPSELKPVIKRLNNNDRIRKGRE